jgi:hypothetical protein
MLNTFEKSKVFFLNNSVPFEKILKKLYNQ